MRNMRFILILFLVAINIHCYSQDSYLKLDTVIPIQNVDKDLLFAKTNEWAAERYNSSKDVIQLSDKESGTLICKGNFLFEWGKSMLYGNLWGYVNYTLTIKFKDGKIRVIFKDFTHETKLPGNMISISLGEVNTGDHPKYGKKKTVKKYWSALQSECYKFSRDVTADIYQYITNKEEDNW